MELKTIKEFAHKGNLGSGLTYENGVFKATVNLNGYLHKNNLGEGLVFSNNKVNVDLDNEFNTIATSLNQLNTKVTLINEQLGTVYKVKGSTTVDNINSMTVGNAMIGYVYNLLDSGVITNGIEGELEVVKGSNIVYTEEGWDEFAVSLDLDLDQYAGLNISIENNVISALGYTYNPEKCNFSTGNFGGWGNSRALGESSFAEGCSRSVGMCSHSEGMKNQLSIKIKLEKYNDYEYYTDYNLIKKCIPVSVYETSGNYLGIIYDILEENVIINDVEYCTFNIISDNKPLNIASGDYILGFITGAYGDYSHTEGEGTQTYNEGEHAEGKWNVSNTGETEAEQTIHSIGIGTSIDNCKNAHEVMNNGDTFIVGIGEYDGTNPYEAKTLQLVITDLENVEPVTYSAGLNISIENDTISAIGYKYDKEKDSFSVGSGTATGQYSHAEGDNTSAIGQSSHAEGSETTANNTSEHAQGQYNISNTGTTADKRTIHSIGIGTYKAEKNAQEVMQNGDHYIIGIGDYDGTNIDSAKTLQEVINELGSRENPEPGINEGYEFDTELNSFRIGREVTPEEIEDLLIATLSMGDTPIIFAKDVIASWQKDTNIIQFTESEYTSISTLVPGTVLQLNTNNDKLICKVVDRNPELYQAVLDKNIPFDYIENISTIMFLHNVAYGKHSVANPLNTASGTLSHAEGYATTAGGEASHTEGAITYAIGAGSHAEGIGNVAYELGSHAEGMITKAHGAGSHAEGILTIAIHEAEHAEGTFNVSNTTDWAGDTIHSIGIGTSNEDRKNALEVTTQGAVYMTGVGNYDGTTLAGCYPILTVVNILLDSKNNDIPAINQRINDLNIPTLPENIVNTVNGKTGDVTIDTSEFATKEEVQVVNTRIDGLNIPSDLSNVVTKTDDYQVTLGTDNNSTHEKTLLVGTGLTTSNNEALVVGAYNNAEYFASWGVDAPAIQVGAGTEDSKRTVMVIQKNGKSLGLLGFEQNGFGDFAEYFEWADGNPEGEDRVGYMVLLNEDKIELAESLDNCIGIITGTGSFVADAACLDWHGRYLKDKWGRNIYELTGVLAENPDYDPTKEYIPREYRKEWSPVGLVGKILVRQDGTLKPNGFVGCVNGIATNVDKSSWRVLKVINEEIALVLIK